MQSAKGVNLVGTTLDQRYLVQEYIAAGSNACVYRAEDLQRKYSVALKVLEGLSGDDKAQERFKHGAEVAIALAHPSIVRLYSFNVSSTGLPYVVTDFVQGHDLGSVLNEKSHFSERQCIAIFSQACDALEHAHAKGVVHRNLKPANIILIAAPGDSYMVKIADFGVAKAHGEKETRQSLAKKGEYLGNPFYMSPEQCNGAPIDGRADIYAVACLLYECLTGSLPYPGANSLEVMNKHVGAPIPQLPPDMPHARQLNMVLERGLAKQSKDRYQSAGEMSHDLNLLLEAPDSEWDDKAVCARPVVVAKAKPAAAAAESESALKFDLVKPFLIVCAVLLLLVGITGGSLLAIAVTDADVKPLLRYKIAVQEIVLPPNDQRLIRNLNYMTEYYKQQGNYADAWKYKEKVLKAQQPPTAVAPQ